MKAYIQSVIVFAVLIQGMCGDVSIAAPHNSWVKAGDTVTISCSLSPLQQNGVKQLWYYYKGTSKILIADGRDVKPHFQKAFLFLGSYDLVIDTSVKLSKDMGMVSFAGRYGCEAGYLSERKVRYAELIVIESSPVLEYVLPSPADASVVLQCHIRHSGRWSPRIRLSWDSNDSVLTPQCLSYTLENSVVETSVSVSLTEEYIGQRLTCIVYFDDVMQGSDPPTVDKGEDTTTPDYRETVQSQPITLQLKPMKSRSRRQDVKRISIRNHHQRTGDLRKDEDWTYVVNGSLVHASDLLECVTVPDPSINVRVIQWYKILPEGGFAVLTVNNSATLVVQAEWIPRVTLRCLVKNTAGPQKQVLNSDSTTVIVHVRNLPVPAANGSRLVSGALTNEQKVSAHSDHTDKKKSASNPAILGTMIALAVVATIVIVGFTGHTVVRRRRPANAGDGSDPKLPAKKGRPAIFSSQNALQGSMNYQPQPSKLYSYSQSDMQRRYTPAVSQQLQYTYTPPAGVWAQGYPHTVYGQQAPYVSVNNTPYQQHRGQDKFMSYTSMSRSAQHPQSDRFANELSSNDSYTYNNWDDLWFQVPSSSSESLCTDQTGDRRLFSRHSSSKHSSSSASSAPSSTSQTEDEQRQAKGKVTQISFGSSTDKSQKPVTRGRSKSDATVTWLKAKLPSMSTRPSAASQEAPGQASNISILASPHRARKSPSIKSVSFNKRLHIRSFSDVSSSDAEVLDKNIK